MTMKKFHMKTNYIFQRSGIFYFRIAVPLHLRDTFGGKAQIWESLKTRDPKEAQERAAPLTDKYKRLFRGDETPDTTNMTFDLFRELIERLGVPGHSVAELQAAPVQDRVAMLSPSLEVRKTIKRPTKAEIDVLGGAIEKPALTFRQAFAKFKQLMPDLVKGKDPKDTKRFWRRYEEAVEDFVEEMSDMDCLKIDIVKASEYRSNLAERLVEGEFKTDAANKKMMWLKIILDEVFKVYHPGTKNPFKELKKFKEDDKEKRPPFTKAEIKLVRERLRASGMSDEAKAICIIGECTGAGAKELAWMTSADIHLDANIPYISIVPNSLRKKVKTGGARHRQIPLVGDALEQMRKFPNGFERFHTPDGPQQINRAMSEFFRKTVPGKGHYSYRHTMDDWLKRSGCDLGIKTAITGHSLKGHAGYYGTDYDMIQKQEALTKALEYAKNNEY
ncbi:DUF6538 domain-containing protein [Sinorhizobium meliloti]|uniref:DUF6538 domain-containing protein n=1 Tax=Rhizobium meliloti TaxID=382 RepID=UPI000FD71233|nr:DUF6538 domain-containing protein [Sinorhizobium meliloti]RVM19918.1 hypothetical protein CN134_02585 [Sinorhizobium meliloti]RVO31825.1 hypothetical protein CN098_11930 [Sinorhizobium meliloti]